mmetsp:Transcript_31167/g.56867  ORF Transcript_31167/g.56867 Transcript_31167/m.56867 type:complete len:103 (-) Transcript_31167:372-680(-)
MHGRLEFLPDCNLQYLVGRLQREQSCSQHQAKNYPNRLNPNQPCNLWSDASNRRQSWKYLLYHLPELAGLLPPIFHAGSDGSSSTPHPFGKYRDHGNRVQWF